MSLFNLRRTWNHLARHDPLWAVLTAPEKSGQRWQLDEFFATGVAEIEAKLGAIKKGYPSLRTGQALDFGCGVGRLSQALAGHFEKVVGVDIADDMLALARQYNRQGERVQYLHNARSDLRRLEAGRFDLVCSLITLQHLKTEYARAYIAEFVRVCAPGGIILFQLPEHSPDVGPPERLERLRFSWWPPTLWMRLKRISLQWIRLYIRTKKEMEMYGIPHDEVCSLLEHHGAHLLNTYWNDAAGLALSSFDYIALKRDIAKS